MKKIVALCRNDFKNIFREPMLMAILLGPTILSITMHFGIPILSEYLQPYFDLEQYYNIITGYLLLFVPILLGMVSGFLILDERDEHVFMTLIVTPLSLDGYILYRILLPMLISLIYTTILANIINLTRAFLLLLIPIIILGAIEASIIALFLAGFAGNKVEGMVLSKALGLLMLAPLAGYFINSPLKYFFGIIPFYWPIQALIGIESSILSYSMHIGVGLLVHMVLLLSLINRLKAKML
ncbi:hypothetical protein [Brassicibacter mesophilus]|uniref:hypothetical protein n=1 Tax=Brassicibacter mesophilus TaxID=745119 RepID=UPI003D1D004E